MLTVVKIGGSVITDKSSLKGFFNNKIVERLAQEIRSASEKIDSQFIVIHGVGSFAHPIAKKFNLHKGYIGKQSNVGFSLCRAAVCELNNLFIRKLLQIGLNVGLVDTFSVAQTTGSKITDFNLSPVNNLLKKKLIPVLSGDIVFDFEQGFAIVSGDALVAYIARKLKAERVVFVSDVDGIYDRNPKKYNNAKLLKNISNLNFKRVIENFESSDNLDVTGEMKGKLLEIRKHLKGMNVSVVNGLVEGNLERSLTGDKVGTNFKF